MTEAFLLSNLLNKLRATLPRAVVIKHCDRMTSGVPDFSVTMNGRTSWWETKYACPSFKSQGIQELTLLRLATAGYARYIVWEEKKGIRQTLIVHPRNIQELKLEARCEGFNYMWVVEQIVKAHV